MKARQKRMVFVVVGLLGLAVAASLVINALDSNLSYFFSPTEVVQKQAPADRIFRLGGLVEEGSVARGDGLETRFRVTDRANVVKVSYSGILPDLFQEGQGVIAQGRLAGDGVFMADEVLAKHDETYMPPEVAEALEKAHKEGTAAQQGSSGGYSQ